MFDMFLYIYWIFIAVGTPKISFLSHEMIEIPRAVPSAQGACVVSFLKSVKLSSNCLHIASCQSYEHALLDFKIVPPVFTLG